MRETKEPNLQHNQKELKSVGAPAHRCPNKGITLIALIITIKIMLILVAVTITTAINGGLFSKAGEAVGKTQNAINQEQQFINDIIEEYFGNSSGGENNGEETGGVTLPEGIKVGDYVNYTPDTGTYKVADGENGSGYTTDSGYQEFTTGSSLQWRVWSIDEDTGEVEIVLATTGPSLTLNGADGYNHAVDILNDLCESLYSKTKNGTKVATGRSINVEDINAKTTYDYTTFTYTGTGFKYGDRKQLSTYGTGYMKYPSLYSQEIGYGYGTGTKVIFNTTGLDGETGLKNGTTDKNGVTTYPAMGYTDGETAGIDPYITYTYYGTGFKEDSYTYYPENCLDTSLGINTAPTGLIKLDTNYWLASRCVDAESNGVIFIVRWMCCSSDLLGDVYLFVDAEQEYTGKGEFCVRPVVSLSSNVSLTIDDENTTETETYWKVEF